MTRFMNRHPIIFAAILIATVAVWSVNPNFFPIAAAVVGFYFIFPPSLTWRHFESLPSGC